MKKPRTKRIIFLLSLVFLLAAYLIYSRPQTVSQLYPMLSLGQCTEIRGYYSLDTQIDLTSVTFSKDSEEFQALHQLFFESTYRRSLRDLFPRRTRTHNIAPGDFTWYVEFVYEDVRFPDGSISSGPLLRFHNWYGELDIQFDRSSRFCRTSSQDAWAKQVLDILQ